VPLALLKRAGLLACVLAALAVSGAGATAIVEYKDIVIKADGGFQPRALPRKQFAPIDFQGYIDIGSRTGVRPQTLSQAVIDFDRDGRLSTTGLPTCAAETVAEASTEEARSLCRGAIVGTGTVEALIYVGESVFPAKAPLTIFNGPASGGRQTVVIHTRTTTPATQTYAIEVPIEKRRGYFRYRATLDIPPIAGGLGVLTRVKVDLGRRYKANGKQRSYVSAHCSDGILQTNGRLTFTDGTVIDGAVDKFCRVK
jgi:hypothetical protein